MQAKKLRRLCIMQSFCLKFIYFDCETFHCWNTPGFHFSWVLKSRWWENPEHLLLSRKIKIPFEPPVHKVHWRCLDTIKDSGPPALYWGPTCLVKCTRGPPHHSSPSASQNLHWEDPRLRAATQAVGLNVIFNQRAQNFLADSKMQDGEKSLPVNVADA